MRRFRARSIAELVGPYRETDWVILALNTEKVHSLKKRSLEVIRIHARPDRGIRPPAGTPVSFYLDEAALVTLGVCYDRVPRFGESA